MEERGKGPLVSVIMPVYNGEDYIRNSINSVYRQSYSSIELIIVDDGSSDGSAKTLNKIADRVPEHLSVKIIHQENRGICAARNRALEEAVGKYIMFMDQDDFIREDCVEILCHEMEDKRAELVIGGFDLVDRQGRVLEQWELKPELAWSKFRITAPWGRMFSRELIERCHIRFMNTKISEDFYFNMLYMSYCNKIYTTSYKGYCWLLNEGSESHTGMKRLEEDRNPLEMLTQLHDEMNQPNVLEKDCVEYMVVKHIVWYLLYVAKGAEKEALKRVYHQCFHWLEEYYPGYTGHILGRMGFPRGESLKTRGIVKIAVLLKKMHLLPVLLACRRL